MNLQLKICGMREKRNIAEVSALKPDYMGFIFFRGSSRFVEGELAPVPAGIKKTGVFVNAPAEAVFRIVEKHKLEAVQLHGEEPPAYCRKLKEAFSRAGRTVELIKVFSVGAAFDFEHLKPYEPVVDLFLFDTLGRQKGGNGVSFNWEILKAYPSQTPFFLSGGIGMESIPEIQKLYTYFEKTKRSHVLRGVDVNSRFEQAPALKKVDELETFRQALLR